VSIFIHGFEGVLAARTLHSEATFQLVEDRDLFKHVRIVDANDNIGRCDGRELERDIDIVFTAVPRMFLRPNFH
jgi:hypothetical protein